MPVSMKIEFSGKVSKNIQISNFMIICQVGAELFSVHVRTWRRKQPLFAILQMSLKWKPAQHDASSKLR